MSSNKAKKFIKFRLQAKLLIGILLLETALMFAITLLVGHEMRESILDEFRKRGLSVTGNLAAINKDFVTTYNYVKIEQNLERVVEENGLLYATVVFFDGDIGGYKGREEIRDIALNGYLHERTRDISETLIQYSEFNGEEFCDIAVPITLGEENWATVRAGFSLDDMQDDIVRTRQLLLVLGFAGLICGYLASVFLARRITRPINDLVENVNAISNGEYRQPIKVRTQDEIGYLSDQFADMTETITKQFQELRESEARLANAQRIAQLGFWEWDQQDNTLHLSEKVHEIFGIPHQKSASTYEGFLEFIHPEDKTLFQQAVQQAIEDSKRSSIEHRILRADGLERVVQQEIEANLDGSNKSISVVGTVQDVSERKQAEQRIRYLAFYDNVTGLPNRTYLKDHLNFVLTQARLNNQFSAVLFLDLDRFKLINDTLGHSAGDELLKEVAERLSHCIRYYDCVSRDHASESHKFNNWHAIQHTVARLGGDEFVIVLSQLRQKEDAATVAQRVNQALRKSFNLLGNDIYITTSIGISLFPEDGNDVETLLKYADKAMYHAKAEGRNRFKYYTSSMNKNDLERLSLESSLRNSLKNSLKSGHFVLHYHPIANTQTGLIVGVEALLRWLHPEKGLLGPGQFIPIAEETGEIVRLGKWVLYTACKQAKSWQTEGLPPIRISVNLSPLQFNHRDLKKTVMQALQETDLDPQYLELELTESTIVGHNIETSIKQLLELRELGVRLSIDDFGTGQSSLSQLKRIPIDSLKIDRSFIRNIPTDSDDAAIVNLTIALGHVLRLTVIAEGVEHEGQLLYLRGLNCDEVQGHLLSTPLAANEIIDFLKENRNILPQHWSVDISKGNQPAKIAHAS
jgi:PAS domain S-box-containing protein